MKTETLTPERRTKESPTQRHLRRLLLGAPPPGVTRELPNILTRAEKAYREQIEKEKQVRLRRAEQSVADAKAFEAEHLERAALYAARLGGQYKRISHYLPSRYRDFVRGLNGIRELGSELDALIGIRSELGMLTHFSARARL